MIPTMIKLENIRRKIVWTKHGPKMPLYGENSYDCKLPNLVELRKKYKIKLRTLDVTPGLISFRILGGLKRENTREEIL
jgi:hypothetical protein